MSYRRYPYRNKKFKKKSIFSKIDNLSYDGLLRWEIAYKNKIKEIENNLNIQELKKKTEELKKLLKILPNENILIKEIEENQSNFSWEVSRFVQRKFWSSDEGIKIGNLQCKDENKMNAIIKKIENLKEKWSLVIPYKVYFQNLEHQINDFRKELEIEKDISTFYYDNYVPGAGGFGGYELYNHFYRQKSLTHFDSSRMSLSGALHSVQKKPMTLKDYVNDTSKWVPCSQSDLKGIDSRDSLTLVGDIWEKLNEIGGDSITYPNIPNQEDIVKYRNFILEKANIH